MLFLCVHVYTCSTNSSLGVITGFSEFPAIPLSLYMAAKMLCWLRTCTLTLMCTSTNLHTTYKDICIGLHYGNCKHGEYAPDWLKSDTFPGKHTLFSVFIQLVHASGRHSLWNACAHIMGQSYDVLRVHSIVRMYINLYRNYSNVSYWDVLVITAVDMHMWFQCRRLTLDTL